MQNCLLKLTFLSKSNKIDVTSILNVLKVVSDTKTKKTKSQNFIKFVALWKVKH